MILSTGAPDEAGMRRIQQRMARVDAMPPDMRALVYEFGLTLVDQFVSCGVRNPRHIRHLIKAVREGSCEIGNRVGQGGQKA